MKRNFKLVVNNKPVFKHTRAQRCWLEAIRRNLFNNNDSVVVKEYKEGKVIRTLEI